MTIQNLCHLFLTNVNNLKDRIEKLSQIYARSMREFELNCGLNRGVLSNIKSDGTIGVDKASKILDKHPEVSPEWLLTGKGEMLKKQESPVHIIKESTVKEPEETRPRIPMDAAAGSLSIAADGILMEQCEQLPVIKVFSRYDFTIFVKGDSMEFEYHSGDELACLYIKNTSFVQWGCVHILDTTQGILVKRIFDAGESILCRSDNDRYPDFHIHKSELHNIALVIGMLRRY